MEAYYNHLVANICQSYEDRDVNTQHEVHPASLLINNIKDQYAHLPVAPLKKVCQWMKLDLETFPPAGRWNEQQLKSLCAMLRDLLHEYNYLPVIPFSLPFDLEYTFLLKALDTYAINTLNSPLTDSEEILEFCEEDKDTCPFGQYCVDGDCWMRYDNDGNGWSKYD